MFDELLMGNFMTPALGFTLGCVFGVWAFVISRGLGLAFPVPYVIALVVGLIVIGGVVTLLKVPRHSDWH